MDFMMGPSLGFGMFQIMSGLIFLLAIGIIVMNLVKGIGEWNNNNHSTRLTVPASVVAKRTDIHRRRGGAHGHRHTSTTYYVTFQVESGDRIELNVSGPEYGMLVEGDRGDLSFQGTRYLGFERK